MGTDTKSVSTALGHSQTQITNDIYVHIFEEHTAKYQIHYVIVCLILLLNSGSIFLTPDKFPTNGIKKSHNPDGCGI